MRLPVETPNHQALQESLYITRRPPGKPKTTCVSRVNQDLKEIGLNLYHGSQVLKNITNNRA